MVGLAALYLLLGCSGGLEEDRDAPLVQQQELVKSQLVKVTPAVVAIKYQGSCRPHADSWRAFG